MSFKISYDELKVLLNVLYGSPYRQVVPYIDMLHGLKEEGTNITLKEKVDLEIALSQKQATPQEG
jgi:hypothetical protein